MLTDGTHLSTIGLRVTVTVTTTTLIIYGGGVHSVQKLKLTMNHQQVKIF